MRNSRVSIDAYGYSSLLCELYANSKNELGRCKFKSYEEMDDFLLNYIDFLVSEQGERIDSYTVRESLEEKTFTMKAVIELLNGNISPYWEDVQKEFQRTKYENPDMLDSDIIELMYNSEDNSFIEFIDTDNNIVVLY